MRVARCIDSAVYDVAWIVASCIRTSAIFIVMTKSALFAQPEDEMEKAMEKVNGKGGNAEQRRAQCNVVEASHATPRLVVNWEPLTISNDLAQSQSKKATQDCLHQRESPKLQGCRKTNRS